MNLLLIFEGKLEVFCHDQEVVEGIQDACRCAMRPFLVHLPDEVFLDKLSDWVEDELDC